MLLRKSSGRENTRTVGYGFPGEGAEERGSQSKPVLREGGLSLARMRLANIFCYSGSRQCCRESKRVPYGRDLFIDFRLLRIGLSARAQLKVATILLRFASKSLKSLHFTCRAMISFYEVFTLSVRFGSRLLFGVLDLDAQSFQAHFFLLNLPLQVSGQKSVDCICVRLCVYSVSGSACFYSFANITLS